MDLRKRLRPDRTDDRTGPGNRRPDTRPDAAEAAQAEPAARTGTAVAVDEPPPPDARDRIDADAPVDERRRSWTDWRFGHGHTEHTEPATEADAEARDRDHDGVDDRRGPLERPTAPTPVTSVRDATDRHGVVDDGRRWPWARSAPAPAAAAVAVDTDGDGVDDRAERVRDRGRTTRRGREVVDEVVIRHWSVADLLITVAGAAVATAGALGLARAEVNSTWYEPVVQVAGANHTPLLAAIELAAGILIVLAGVARRRIVSTLLGVALGVTAAVVALQVGEVRTELAIEQWWAWVMCGAGAFVALMALVPRKGHIERVGRPAEGPAGTEADAGRVRGRKHARVA